MGDNAPSLKRVHTEDGSVSPPPVKRKQQSGTTNSVVANFFTPASQKPKTAEKVSWTVLHDSLIIGRYQAAEAAKRQEPQKIAVFDFDSTLISSASGRTFAKDATDWKWWHGTVPTKLRDLHKDGYLIAILSNQGGISLKSNNKPLKADLKRLADFKAKVANVLIQLDLPIGIYAATAKDEYRKPRTGMWRKLLEYHDLTAKGSVHLEDSFFVGDAGGRTGARKDFSCSDRDFASNVGIRYMTPEEYFLGEEPKPFKRDFEPAAYLGEVVARSKDAVSLEYTKNNPKDLVLFCGSPGAGKSTFYWDHLRPLGYERVNQDILKTRDRCLKAASDFLANGKSVAVDNTNADPETRLHWIKLATKHEVPVRCVLFTAPAKLCEHNDTVRALNGVMNPENRAMLPGVAFRSFSGRYREPRLTEGLQDITKVDFTFEGNEEQREIWSKYWI
ncbi:PNK3P-domain-containing protein [Saccharata proteae CBS 121410]|uniref:PNK3P-domain-containing protein n=1 Tax=Saccharata proteae CBS 121410 TaxID=1314787 RepID=A0A9P4HSR7_9PEZI|nr:PNK3P-domain-containing protein [Saccharata proteae CBS 121410]